MADTRLTTRFPGQIIDRLVDRAEAERTTTADLVRQAVASYLADADQTDRLAQMEARICQHVTREIDSLTQPDGGRA